MEFPSLMFCFVVMHFVLICYGAYQATLVSLAECDNPEPPYEKNRKVSANLTTRHTKDNVTVIGGTIEIKENLIGYLWRLKTGVIKHDTPKYNVDSKGMTCNNIIARIIIISTKIKADLKSCKLFKGVSVFDNFDVKKIDKAVNFIPVREMGMNSWILSIYGPQGTCLCYDVRMLLKYIK